MFQGNLAGSQVVSKSRYDRTVIIGNSGSGKSWLSIRLANALGTAAIDLDGIHWEPGGHNVARDKQLAIEAVRQTASRQAWIIEGVYGWLAREALPKATALIWLDLPIGECIANLRQRSLQHGRDEASFLDLLAWASDYPHRQTSSSLAGHGHIFATFPAWKLRLSSQGDMGQLLAQARTGCLNRLTRARVKQRQSQ